MSSSTRPFDLSSGNPSKALSSSEYRYITEHPLFALPADCRPARAHLNDDLSSSSLPRRQNKMQPSGGPIFGQVLGSVCIYHLAALSTKKIDFITTESHLACVHWWPSPPNSPLWKLALTCIIFLITRRKCGFLTAPPSNLKTLMHFHMLFISDTLNNAFCPWNSPTYVHLNNYLFLVDSDCPS